jgi:hypothetical protein
MLFSDDPSFLGRLVCVDTYFRFESLFDWINPSSSPVVCLQASTSSSLHVESSSPSPCKLTFGSIALLRCAANFSVEPPSDGLPVPSLFSLGALLLFNFGL